MAKPNPVDPIELDVNCRMTVEQTFARASREPLDKVIIVGLNPENRVILFTSDMPYMEAYWALNRAVEAVFDD